MTTEFARQDLAQNSTHAAEPDRVRVIREGVASYLPDIDTEETGEWLESFDQLVERSGPARARYLRFTLTKSHPTWWWSVERLAVLAPQSGSLPQAGLAPQSW